MTGQAWDQDDQERFRADLQATIDGFLDEQADRLAPLGDDAARLVAEARAAVTGGKRFRAAFCYWGFRAAARDQHDDRAILRAAASLELLHASALVHDDLMDASDTRRGRPATHRGFADLHQEQAWPGDPEQYGAAAAILLGDLLLSWSDELLRRCGMPWDRVGPALDVLRPLPVGGHRRPVPRRVRAGPRLAHGRRRDDRAALQVGEVLDRAAAPHRRRAGRRRRRTR